ncbi:SMP-30/gluconolactonase/LRE family protein [Actinomadura sp. DC4]|uniref:SMP-30/gluconolactonase/LRE family protein n=1 Tax=Actinomadura sp. DC4 TaxID=3055069 RepID=UPI0025B225EB|nr:SMP-30/gluconolactonase/LRE family protein [Actinomadura sp. DC4]MDN3358739.1 SMP-30/gluconolactonase/LRE family protein [Actinomadura sp. DC4]
MTRTLLTGLMIGESPRWHEGRLWFSNWGSQEVLAVDAGGKAEVMARVPTTLPFSIDWLPDGRLLVVSGPEALLLRQEPDGSLVRHAGLGHLARIWNEIVVDGRGNVYVNGMDFDFLGGGDFVPGIIALVTPDGAVRQVAGDIMFPNGMVITPDGSTLIVAESFASRLTAFDIGPDGGLSGRRVWAELGQGGDGICIDAEGAVWSSVTAGGRPACARVREGGEVERLVELDQGCFACMLGGEDGRTLFMLTADWRGPEQMDELLRARTGRLVTAPAPVPGAGKP